MNPEKNMTIREQNGLSHMWHVLGSNPQRRDVLIFIFAFLFLCNLSGWQMSCQNVDFHNQCDHKAISSEKNIEP